jgi:hypothetical protein
MESVVEVLKRCNKCRIDNREKNFQIVDELVREVPSAYHPKAW